MQKPCFYLFYVMFGRKKDLTDRFYNLKISYLDHYIGIQKNVLEEKKIIYSLTHPRVSMFFFSEIKTLS